MARVGCIEIPGLELWFNSLDHGPPHFHVRKAGHWEIRIYFRSCTETHLDFEEKWKLGKRGPSPGERTRVLREVLNHREELFREWEQKVLQ